MLRVIIISIIFLLIVGIYCWLRKKKTGKEKARTEKVFDNSDYQRLKIKTSLKCLECEECIMDNKDCCSNCLNNLKTLGSERAEIHCKEHYHHSNYGGTKGLLSLVWVPLLGGLVVYRVIRVLSKKNKC